jgi:hypothetical protein
MLTQILFEIPAAYEVAVRSGALVQIGGLLKDSATGKIVAHLQESGLAHSLINKAVLGATSPHALLAGEALNLGAGIYTALEITKLKAMMATLQSLQIATMGIALVGIGVSVAGFYHMNKRFDAVEAKLDVLLNEIRTGFNEQHQSQIRSRMSQMKSLITQSRQAHTLSNPNWEYSRIAEASADEAAYFQGEVEFILKASGKINPELFWQLAQALMVCNSLRMDCRLRTNELRNAQAISENVALDYQKLFDPITPISFDSMEHDAAGATRTLRDISDSAATKPYLIDYIRVRGINGAEYLQRLEDEKDAPLLVLKEA